MTERRYSNKFRGPCYKCGNRVEERAGFCLKLNGKWAVEHDGECPPKVDAAPAAAPQAPKENQFGGKCALCGKYVPEKQGTITKTAAGWKARHLTPADCEAAQAAPAPKAPRTWNVPTGYYAVASRKPGQDLDFFRVNTPTKGKWVGWSFAEEMIGGQGRTKIDRQSQVAALDAIEAAGADVAGKLYADKIHNCYKCNLLLTDDESRARGMGLKCFKKLVVKEAA